MLIFFSKAPLPGLAPLSGCGVIRGGGVVAPLPCLVPLLGCGGGGIDSGGLVAPLSGRGLWVVVVVGRRVFWSLDP